MYGAAPCYSHGFCTGRAAIIETVTPMTYLVSATIDDLARTSEVRHHEREALALALHYLKLGYREIRVETEDAEYSLEQFRFWWSS